MIGEESSDGEIFTPPDILDAASALTVFHGVVVYILNKYTKPITYRYNMRMELPIFIRCCFCVPVRYGLMVWGYFHLFVGCLLSVGAVLIIRRRTALPESDSYKVTPDFIWVVCIVVIVGVAEITMSVLFIVGCHKKNLKLLKIFYFYIILSLGLTAIFFVYYCIEALITTIKNAKDSEQSSSFLTYLPLVDMGLFVAYFVFEFYVLLVLRSEILKLSNDCRFRFANIGGEAECFLTVDNFNKQATVQHDHTQEEGGVKTGGHVA